MEIDSEWSSSLNNIGLNFFKLGLYEKALEYYEKAIELEPDERIYINNKADVLEKLNENSVDVGESPKRVTSKQLIESGKSKGYLSLSEIMEAFSETVLDKEQIETLYETLGNLGIQAIEDEDLDAIDFKEDIVYDEIDFDDVEELNV